MELPPLPMHMRRAHNRSAGNCGRPNCRHPAAISLNWDGLVMSYCAEHADTKAVENGARVEWLANGYDVCRLCGRVLLGRQVRERHINAVGGVCPPDAVRS